MLQNLKSIYIRRADLDRGLRTLDLILTLRPNAALDRRDRGLILRAMERDGAALDDLIRYTELSPHASDSEEVRKIIRQLIPRVAKWN
jgi:regulator of sirC expression with transglutaminase-like and TPR domain